MKHYHRLQVVNFGAQEQNAVCRQMVIACVAKSITALELEVTADGGRQIPASVNNVN